MLNRFMQKVSVPSDANLCWNWTGVDNMQDRLVRGRNPNAVKTHCKKGHEYTPDNTYVYNNMRSCKKCKAISFNNFKERKRENLSN